VASTASQIYANLHLKLNVSSQSELFALLIEWLRQHQKIATCDCSYWGMQSQASLRQVL
jgi:hypothetical protein